MTNLSDINRNTVAEEQGTFTPTLEASSGSVSSYNTQEGQYVKIGDMVFFECYLNVSNIGTLSGSTKVAGLPYLVNNNDRGWSVTIGQALSMNITAGRTVVGWLDQNDDFFWLHLFDTSGGVSSVSAAEASTMNLYCSGMYRIKE